MSVRIVLLPVTLLKLHLDFETRSAIDLKRAGLYRYAEHPSTAIWLFAYRLGAGLVREWRPGQTAPTELLDHIVRGGIVCAHNANFERQIWNVVLRRLGECASWPRLNIGQMDCTMARALAVHLPPDLETLGATLSLSMQKDSEGRKLMLKMSKPKPKRRKGAVPLAGLRTLSEPQNKSIESSPDRQCEVVGAVEWHDDPEDIERLGLYCQQDVLTECEADERLPPLSDAERGIWELDQKINDRGIAVDVSTIEKVVEVLAEAQNRANVRMFELTNGAVCKVTEASKLVVWLQSKGLPIDSIAKAEKDDVMEWSGVLGDERVDEAIQLRFETGKNSTAKYKRILESVCDDGRCRGLLQYHRAGTGRWGGAIVQPQNMPRVDESEMLDVLGALDMLNV